MLHTLDIPQANDLHTVRAVVNAVRRGSATRGEIADFTGFSIRHVAYRLHAARVLGLVALDGESARLLPPGERLLTCAVGSQAERASFFDAVNACNVVQRVVPELLAPMVPDLALITAALIRESNLSQATADRRARGLLRWRGQILGRAAVSPPVPVAAEPKAAAPEVSTPAPAPAATPAAAVKPERRSKAKAAPIQAAAVVEESATPILAEAEISAAVTADATPEPAPVATPEPAPAAMPEVPSAAEQSPPVEPAPTRAPEVVAAPVTPAAAPPPAGKTKAAKAGRGRAAATDDTDAAKPAPKSQLDLFG